MKLRTLSVVLAALVSARGAFAQIHWDLGVQAGLMQRGLTEGVRSLGPAFEVHGHVALVPLVRVGAYGAYDFSPVGAGTTHLASFGARGKVTFPWRPTRLWVFAGVGQAVVFGTHTGHFLEVPVGVGLGVPLRSRWQLYGELGGRFGFVDGDDRLALCASLGIQFDR